MDSIQQYESGTIPPYWQRYYTLYENKFASEDMQLVKMSIQQYKERKGVPTYTYHRPHMTPQSRYRWDRAFEQHHGGLVLRDSKTGRILTKEEHEKIMRDIEEKTEACTRPSNLRGRRLNDCNPQTEDDKHEHNPSKPDHPTPKDGDQPKKPIAPPTPPEKPRKPLRPKPVPSQ